MQTTFELDPIQRKKLLEWMDSFPDLYSGAIGGAITFEFTPTSLGVIVIVKRMSEGEGTIVENQINLTDFDSW